jgi:hypothetical protein
MITAPQPAILHEPIGQVCTAVGALTINQTEIPAEIPVEDEILPHKPHRLDAVRLELADTGNWKPMSPQDLTHRGSRPDLRQQLILSGIHFYLPKPSPLQI